MSKAAAQIPPPALDVRVKLTLTLTAILCISLTPSGSWAAYILFFALTLSAGIYFRLRLGAALRRALLALPFALAALPLLFAGPPPIQTLPLPAGWSVPFSPLGAERLISIVIKASLSVQCAYILIAATPSSQLLAAMRSLGVPGALVVIALLMERYLFVLQDEAQRLLRARQSRSSRLEGRTPRPPGGSLLWRGRVAGGMAGSLLLRSLERSERVYAAMLARGFNGSPPLYHAAPLSAFSRGAIALGGCLLFSILLIGWATGGR